MSKARALGLFLFGLSSFLISCGDGEGAANRRLLPAQEKKLDLTAEAQRVRDMQKVRFRIHDGDYKDEWYEDSADYLAGELWMMCGSKLLNDEIGNYSACGAAVKYHQFEMCVAEALLGASKVRAEPYRVASLFESGDLYVEIPQQSQSANAAMLKIALSYAINALDSAPSDWRWNIMDRCANGGLGDVDPRESTPNETTTFADEFYAVLARAYELGTESAYLEVENILAVSDAERSSTASSTSASRRQWVQEDLSRLAAAQVLIGGAIPSEAVPDDWTGLSKPPDFPQGFCPNRPLSAQAQRAMALLRAGAPSAPALLDSEVPTKTILDGELGSGSLRERLAQIYRDPSLADSPDLAGHFGLQISDFDDARAYLTDEMRAFARDPNETMAPSPGTTFEPYTAVRVVPSEAPDGYYAALAAGPGDHEWYDAAGYKLTSSLSYFREEARRYGAGIGVWIDFALSAPTASDQILRFKQVGESLQRAALSDTPGWLQLWANTGEETLFVSYGTSRDPTSDDYWLVSGEKGLYCATRGTVEGRQCKADELVATKIAALAPTYPFSSNCSYMPYCVHATVTPVPFDMHHARVYLVRGTATNAQPGAFVLEAAAELRGRSMSFGGKVPGFSPDYAKVAEILRPSKSSCDRPQISCAGVSLDGRLPLEDELTDDNNGVESSWRHYLDLAKQAAQDSDDLGSAFVNSSLEVDRNVSEESIRLEQQRQQVSNLFETIQNTCGTSADPQKILDLILGQDKEGAPCDIDNPCLGAGVICTDGKCVTGIRTCDDVTQCDPNSDCASGVCIPNLDLFVQNATGASDPDIQRLTKCINGGEYKYVGLGDHVLCAWVDPDTNVYCPQTAARSGQCPYLGNEDEPFCNSGDVAIGRDESIDHSNTTDLLAQFHIPQKVDDDANVVCEAVVALRDKTTPEQYQAALQTIVGSKIFFPQQIIDTAKRVGFEARFGTYSAITLDGSAIFQTGSMNSGPNNVTWPCAKDTSGQNSTLTFDPSKSLWGQLGNCGDDHIRGAINDRLMKAVYLARYIGGNATGKGLVVPAWAYGFDPRTMPSTTILVDGSNGEGVINEINTKLGNVQAKVYWSEDNNVLNATTPAYVTDGQELPVQAMNVGTGVPEFVFAWVPTLWPKETVGRLAFGEFASPSNGAPPNFGLFPGLSVELFGAFELLDSNAVASWFSGMSSAVQPAPTKKAGDGLLIKLLQNLAENSPVAGLDGYKISTRSSFNTQYVGSLAGDAPFSANGLLDAVEVLCRARVVATSGVKPDLNVPFQVNSAVDLPQVKARMDIIAAQIEDWAGRFLIPNFPRAAADYMRKESNSGVVPALGGTYATAMTTLRSDLIDLAQVAPLMAYELRQLGLAIDQARIATSQVDLTEELQELNYQATLASSAAACASAAASTISNVTSFGASSAVACASAIVQGIIAAKQLNVQKQQDDLQKQSALASFQGQLNTHAQALQSYADRISKALEGIDGMIAELERQRFEAKRALAEAVRVASFTPTNTENIAATLAHQRETARLRYEQAFKNAKLMADLAKRSIEQRLGMQLSQMTHDLPLVEAPQSWEGTVCDRSGINWDQVRSNNPDVPGNFADAFIGDYVSKLERVVESYRLEHSFHEGTDTAVVSMRDDVFNVRAPCSLNSKNLLLHSNDLNASAAADGTGGWSASGCIPRSDSDNTILAPQNCVSVIPVDEKATADDGDLGGIHVFSVFGGKANRAPCASEPRECDYQAEAGWAQRVHLGAGIYRLSFYMQSTSNPSSDYRFVSQRVVSESKGDLPLNWYPETTQSLTGRYWDRLHAIFTLTEADNVTIKFVPVGDTDADVETGLPGLLAAPMLEKIPLPDEQTDDRPGPAVTVTDSSLITLRACEDTTGQYFRQNWRLGEVPLCPAGFSGSCNSAQTTIHRYREIPFSINQRDLESGRILSKAGFAVGNFNYRIDSIGVNFVGTGVKNCTDSSSPTTCYSNGSVQYSLDHVGPYYVRNHEGGTYEAKLFTGHIEHARGLAAERYITNPISSTDQQLMSDYMRSELQGRPLDGNFVLRLWENPGMYFDGINDIQIVLKYRYWTRFD